jgi:hypothetical protein
MVNVRVAEGLIPSQFTGILRIQGGVVAGMRKFRTLEKLRQTLANFLVRHNRHWVGQRPGSRTPPLARKQLLALGAAA